MTHKIALVVDDSKLARITLRKKLEQRDLQVDMVASAREAFDYLEMNKPDIIFMDHLMPEIDGFEATKQIKANPNTHHIPIIMCSGKENDNYLEEAQAIGADSILSKPPEAGRLDDILINVSTREAVISSTTLSDSRTATSAAQTPAFIDTSAPMSTPMDMKPGMNMEPGISKIEVIALLSESLDNRFAENEKNTAAAINEELTGKLTKVQETIEKHITKTVNRTIEQAIEKQQQSVAALSEEVEEQQQALDQRVSELAQSQSTVDKSINVSTEQLRPIVSLVVESALDEHLSNHLEKKVNPQLEQIKNQLRSGTAKLDRNLVQGVVSEQLVQFDQGEELTHLQARISEIESHTRQTRESIDQMKDELLKMLTDSLAGEKEVMQTKVKRLTVLLGAGISACLLLVVALGVA